MKGALWIAAFLAAVGIILYVGELIWRRRHPTAASDSTPMAEGDVRSAEDGSNTSADKNADDSSSGECCGLHLVCEKDSLSPMSQEIIYYDDEELDRFIGRDPHSYTGNEEEEFRDVLMTLRPEDVTGWARSITQRRIELPAEVRDELLMLVNEQRQKVNNSH
ncbi:MAG: hypothetical protein ACI304_04780 [Lepagella sp.]